MYRVMIGDFVRPRERRPDLPEALERLILHAMALDPEQRPPSAMDLERAARRFCRQAFRDRPSSSILDAGPPAPTPAPTPGPGRASGNEFRRSNLSTDHTAMIGGGTPPPGFGPSTGGTAPAVTSPERPSARRRSRAPWIIAAIVVAGGIAVTAVIAGRGDGPMAIAPSPPAPAAPPAAAAAPPAAPAQPAAVPAQVPADAQGAAPPTEAHAPPDAAAATVTLRFAVEPAGAAILVDGARIQGSELVVPRDDRTHTLRITAPGRLAHDETVRFDESQRLVVQLRRAGGRGNDGKPHAGSADRIDSESPY